jgi:hypothetical protein
MLFCTQRSWFVRPERRRKDVSGFQLESKQRIVDHARSTNFAAHRLRITGLTVGFIGLLRNS